MYRVKKVKAEVKLTGPDGDVQRGEGRMEGRAQEHNKAYRARRKG